MYHLSGKRKGGMSHVFNPRLMTPIPGSSFLWPVLIIGRCHTNS